MLDSETRFVSLRWRFLLPLFAAVLVVAMVGAYVLAHGLSGDMAVSQTNILVESSRAMSQRAMDVYERLRTEAQAVAFTIGVPDAVISGDFESLVPVLETTARRAAADSIIVTDANGIEVAGVRRAAGDDDNQFFVSAGADLSAEGLINAVLLDGTVGASGLLRTPDGLLVYTGVPIRKDGQVVGVALVGLHMPQVIEQIDGGSMADVAVYGPDGRLFYTTLDAGLSPVLSDNVFSQALRAVEILPIEVIEVGQEAYHGLYFPFTFGPNRLGVMGTFLPDNMPFATAISRQLTGILLAGVAAVVVIGVFVGLNVVVGRLNRVTQVAYALATGDQVSRTNMQPADEIGEMGYALDRYADYVQDQQDRLRGDLRRQRRESEHLTAVLESLPDGAVVQDRDGRVILMNAQARELLGSQRFLSDNASIEEVTAFITDTLGPVIAPGLYALGSSPQAIHLNGRLLQAQAAAVMTLNKQRVGTVILLRDVTDDARRQQAQAALIRQLASDIQEPLSRMAHGSPRSTPMQTFAQEIRDHAIALQKIVLEMRELNSAGRHEDLTQQQTAINLDTLVWAVANEWRQVAQANNLTLHVSIELSGLFVLGNERRLRWALGNIIDNAIKYTPPGGALGLEIRDLGTDDSRAHLRIRDNGVGIAPDELEHVLTRFYRGTPVTAAGRVIHVPGTGQGLTTARQIIEMHGGELVIRSKQHVGTAVYISIPLTAPISLELPPLEEELDGETIRLRPRNQQR